MSLLDTVKTVANVVTNPVGAVLGLVGDAAKKLGTDKVDTVLSVLNGPKGDLPPELRGALDKFEHEYQQGFMQFMAEYEGDAASLPTGARVVRSMVRPILSLVIPMLTFAFSAHVVLHGTISPENFMVVITVLGSMWAITLAVVGFWFGERLLLRVGPKLIEKFK